MAIKILLNNIQKYLISHEGLGYNIFFCNAKVKGLYGGPHEVWGFDHRTFNVRPQKNDVLVCADGLLRIYSRHGNKRLFYHFRKIDKLPAGTDGSAPALAEMQAIYTKWRAENETWQPPLTLEVGEPQNLHIPGNVSVMLYPIGATNMQMVRLNDHIHFTCKGLPISRPSPYAFFITPAGTLWQRKMNEEGFHMLNQPNLVFPTPPHSRKKR